MTGTSGTTSREVESQGSLGVELDPIRQLIFTVGEANVGTLRSEGVWQCQSNGRILIRWPEKPTDSEGWIASSRSLDIEHYVAADRSLVVKLTIRDLATSLLATRHRSESTEWLLFRRS